MKKRKNNSVKLSKLVPVNFTNTPINAIDTDAIIADKIPLVKSDIMRIPLVSLY